jgi:N-methylhydantoinase A/oxoprolinase/acetone carboxylase beta subunit
MDQDKEVAIITSDAGGTMTDIFVVDKEGDFVIGKASTTSGDESIGFWESLGDAFSRVVNRKHNSKTCIFVINKGSYDTTH